MRTQLFPTSQSPQLGPESSVSIIIVAVLFLLAVFAFYFFVS